MNGLPATDSTANGAIPLQYQQFQEFWRAASERQVIFFYAGYFSQHVVSAIAETIRARLDAAGTAGPTSRRIFSAFVEMSQNIMHYSADALTPAEQPDRQIRGGAFCIGVCGERFHLLCANPVASERVEAIRARIEPLCAMTVDEIRSAYRTALRQAAPEDSKGAGLGLLTMARDASAPLAFHFLPDSTDAGRTVFCIAATI
ncbi:SiaB family protein kinase [Pseudoduganella sp. SL102]|uniref:SiaB family protein kinase n=1 Tax=Pseudoduganella sp. SL102 TaxID=2995154 RepID=UPI00248AFAD9|nr:SiaB family protein kinase [Pseudoduganella sp. SL102]WBS05616.1 SiaB family protein kinase [Pseudoduganella sp. SL102]